MDEMIIGLGSGGGGYFEVFDYADGMVIHKDWLRIHWKGYNAAYGETRPACGDIDGDGHEEIVVGLAHGGGGYLEIFDDGSAGYGHLAWAQIQWKSYNSSNGESRPACGDMNGDGKDEIIIGLGKGGGGWFEICNYNPNTLTHRSGTVTHQDWVDLNFQSYNINNGETRPACGDVDGDGMDEMIIGLGSGGGGYFAVFDYADGMVIHRDWGRIHWTVYNTEDGETWLAVRK
jgi:hypothetical protein